jgi:hypothetical protein
MRKHFVEFLSPGSFVDESTSKEISSWDPVLATKMANRISERYGAKPYGFVFSTSIVSKDIPDGEGGALEVKPKVVEKSGVYFLGGWLETLDQVEARNDPEEEILRSNMKGNGIFVICFNTNSYKSCHEFGVKDCLLDSKGNVVEKGDYARWTEYRKTRLKKEA